MREAGCSHLVYGYKSFSPHVMKTVGKGATPETNIRSFFWTLDAGIRPVPNQIIGFPNEDFESLRQNMEAWKMLGIVVKPHFATPYPGCEWFTTNRALIEEQYGGDLEAFILDLGDASRISAVNFPEFQRRGIDRPARIDVQDGLRQDRRVRRDLAKNHHIPEGAPSTLFAEKMTARSLRTATPRLPADEPGHRAAE